MAKKKITKKKGPKGKKARAKAKLERQWGETAIIDDEKPRRVGNSRLLKRTKNGESNQTIRWAPDKKEGLEPNPKAPETFAKPAFSGVLKKKQPTFQSKKHRSSSDDDDDFSDSEGDSEDEDTPAVHGLLSSIRRVKNKSENRKPQSASREVDAQVDNEGMGEDVFTDTEMGHSSESDLSDDEGGISDDNLKDGNGDDDDGSISEHMHSSDDKRPLDLFHQRFSRFPLKKEELTNMSSTSNKVSMNDMLEFQVMIPSMTDDSSGENFDSNTTPGELKTLADSSFECNRTFLQRRWKRLNKSTMTETQFSIYPFLTRYMDLFVTTDSRKVRAVN